VNHLTPIESAVLATDGSEHAHAAATFAGALDWPHRVTISVVSVVEVPNPSDVAISRMRGKGFEDWRRVLELSHFEARDRALADVAAVAAGLRTGHPAAVIDEVICVGEPAAELLGVVQALEAQLIVAGARGHTALHELLLGSVGEALVTEAPCPVLIVRRPVTDLTTVLVAVRTLEDADRLAEACLRLPLPPATRLVAVSASAPQPAVRPGHQPFAAGKLEALLETWAVDEGAELEAAGQRFIERIRAEDPERPVAARIVRGELSPSAVEARADIAPALLAEAEALDASLIVFGARERHGLTARLGLGSVSRKLVRRAPMAVLVVREAAVKET
jgi:nucleotide-binding universal stress UspA family protein